MLPGTEDVISYNSVKDNRSEQAKPHRRLNTHLSQAAIEAWSPRQVHAVMRHVDDSQSQGRVWGPWLLQSNLLVVSAELILSCAGVHSVVGCVHIPDLQHRLPGLQVNLSAARTALADASSTEQACLQRHYQPFQI